MRYGPLILWVGVIFFLSSSMASLTGTSRFIRPLLVFLFPEASAETLLIYHGYIRKFAHFAEYAVLGALAAHAFSNSSVQFLKKHWLFIAIGFILSIATLDEFNQSFENSRTASIWDVLLDLAGGLTTVFLAWIFKKPRPHTSREKAETLIL